MDKTFQLFFNYKRISDSNFRKNEIESDFISHAISLRSYSIRTIDVVSFILFYEYVVYRQGFLIILRMYDENGRKLAKNLVANCKILGRGCPW